MHIHAEITGYILNSRRQSDSDVAVEILETAVEKINAAVGFEHAGEVPASEDTTELLLQDARTCLRNSNLTGCRIRLLQVIDRGGPETVGVDTAMPLDKMTKAQLQAYASERTYLVPVAATKAELLSKIRELDAQAGSAESPPAGTAEPKPLTDMSKPELQAYASERGYDIDGSVPYAAVLAQIEELDAEAAIEDETTPADTVPAEPKSLDDMSKPELQAYALERGYDIDGSVPYAAMLAQVEELDDQAAEAAETGRLDEMTVLELTEYAQQRGYEVNLKVAKAKLLAQIKDLDAMTTGLAE